MRLCTRCEDDFQPCGEIETAAEIHELNVAVRRELVGTYGHEILTMHASPHVSVSIVYVASP